MRKCLAFLILLLLLVIAFTIAFSNSSLVFDLYKMEYKSNGKELKEIEVKNTGTDRVTFSKAVIYGNNNANLKEVKLGSIKMWSNDSNSQPFGALLPLENVSIAAGEDDELSLKFDNDATNHVSMIVFELGDGSSVFVKILEGYVTGTLDYQIRDGSNVIGTESAKNATIYLIPSGFALSNPSLLLPLQLYHRNITLDADGAGSRCSTQLHTTQQYFYDDNNDGKNAITEKLVYGVQTNQQGCYAFNVPEGNYDIYTG